MKLFLLLRATALMMTVWCCLQGGLRAAEPVSFRNQIAPLLLEHCTSCHGPKKAEGGYRVDSFAQLSKAGDSGIEPLAVEGEHVSELLRRLTTEDASERMPAEREPLPADAIELIGRWQSEGGKFNGEDPQAALFDIVPPAKYPAAPESYPAAIAITAVAFSPDGTQVVAGGYHELTVWDAATGELKRRIQNMPERVYAVDWSADRKHLAVAGGTPGRIGEVRLIDWESGQVVASFGRATDVVQGVRYQPGGKLLATANTDGTLRLFDTSDWHLVRSLASHADSVAAIDWSHDGKRIASASRDKTAKVFEAETGDLVATYSGHGEPVLGICFNEGDKELTTVGADKKVHRWKVDDQKAAAKVDLPAAAMRLVVDRTNVWLGLQDHTVRQLELAATKVGRQLDGHTTWVTSLSAHADSNRLVSGSLSGEIRVWKLDDGSCAQKWIAAPGYAEPSAK